MADFSVVLVGPKYQGNIGSIARVMKNFGLHDLLLIDPPEIEAEARQKAMHAQDVLRSARIFDDIASVKEEFDFLVGTSAITGNDKNFIRVPVKPQDLASAIDSIGTVGLVFGREDIGLSNDEILLCDVFVNIPSNGKYPTLSLPQSVGIILYELKKQEFEKNAKGNTFRQLNKKEKDVMLVKFDDLVDIQYSRKFENNLVKKTFRQVVGRAFISGREAYTLIGLFRKSAEKIKAKHK